MKLIMSDITLRTLVVRFKWPILLTNLLVFLESILGVLIPLFIGLAINDLLEQSYRGVIYLIVLGVSTVAVGSLRRFHDTRAYSRMFQIIAPEMVEREQKKDSSVSKIIARTSLLDEIVQFLEWSVPAVVGAAVYLIATLVIIAGLNLRVFFASLLVLLLTFVVYVTTGKFNLKLNENYNDELENEVTALESRDHSVIKNYYRTLMRWNIKLADLGTFNYLIVMLGTTALLVYTPIAVIKGGVDYYGLVFSAVLYVFEFIAALIALPDHIQQVIRLNEISGRLSD
jgi:ABC-type multidrug transport system fused ATPase/permease subunit